MRKSGSTTKKFCWILEVVINDEIIKHQQYRTLRDISNELNMSYNIISEMALGRKKNKVGIYEPQYIFKKINRKTANSVNLST